MTESQAIDNRGNKLGDTDGIPLPWKLKGHALERSWSGKHGASNARGQCECGWYYKGWTNNMGMVVLAHRSHLRRERLARLQSEAA